MRVLSLLLVVSALSGPAHAACPSGPQARQQAQQAARAAARQQLGSAAALYAFLYSNVSSDLKVSRTSLSGNSAVVYGQLVLRGTERKSGRPASGSYPGTVFLKRDPACVWRVTGYQRG